MEKVKLKGKLKVYKKHYFKNEEIIRNIDKDGWLENEMMFHTKEDKSGESFMIVKDKKAWTPSTILVEKLNKVNKKSNKPKVEQPTNEGEEVSGDLDTIMAGMRLRY